MELSYLFKSTRTANNSNRIFAIRINYVQLLFKCFNTDCNSLCALTEFYSNKITLCRRSGHFQFIEYVSIGIALSEKLRQANHFRIMIVLFVSVSTSNTNLCSFESKENQEVSIHSYSVLKTNFFAELTWIPNSQSYQLLIKQLVSSPKCSSY